MNKLSTIRERLKKSVFVKDSLWAVFGNGIGYFLLLIAGILIARFLGKDVYGEYGVVKTTMFQIAAFSTFGLGYTTTKYIAQYYIENKCYIKSIVHASIKITSITSISLCFILLFYSNELALFLEKPQLAIGFKYLGIIIICRSISTTEAGLLAGFKNFKSLGKNNVYSGLIMILSCVPLTLLIGIRGAFLALLFSQMTLTFLNTWSVYRQTQLLNNQINISFVKPILNFSFPVALQEFSYSVCHWGALMILTKYASLGDVGIYTATTQWNAIIIFIPGLLSNVILSYLSSSMHDSQSQNSIIKKVLLVNLACTIVPLCIVLLCSETIVAFYGKTFSGMQSILYVSVISTIFICVSNIFQSRLIAVGANWELFLCRLLRDVLIIIALFCGLYYYHIENAAFYLVSINLLASFLYLLGLLMRYIFRHSL